MDYAQKVVLRRKRPLLADRLTFSVAYQKKYKEYGLLDDRMLPEVMVEQTDFGQMAKFLDLLHQRGGNAFEKFCQLLLDEGHSWLRDEMKADLLAEKGELQVEEYVYRESGMHVHKKFGKSKRISEIEKKEVQGLIAIRYQAAKEAWQHQLELVRRQLEEANHSLRGENGRLKSLLEKVSTFLHVQKPRLSMHSHDLVNALSLVREDPDPEGNKQDYFRLLDDVLDQVLQVLARVLLEKEKLDDERSRCLQILKVDRPTACLDLILQEALQRAVEDSIRSKREADLSDKMAKGLDEDIKSLRVETDREMANRDRQLLYAESLARQREERVRQLEKLLLESRNSHSAMKEEMENWKQKCEMLEKTRRLGYYYPGWQDKLYNMADIEYAQEEGSHGPPKLALIGCKSTSVVPKSKTTILNHSQERNHLEKHPIVVKKTSPRKVTSPGSKSEDKLLHRGKTSIVYQSSSNC